MATSLILLMMAVLKVSSLESPSPEKFLQPRDFNPHPYTAQFQAASGQLNTRNGPVLFPNNLPPPSPTPLVVTARPLSEQMIRSDQNTVVVTPRPLFNPSPLVNAVNQIQPIQLYYNDYPDLYRLKQNATNLDHPYAAVASKSKLLNENIGRKQYDAIEEHTVVPPIYNALANYAKQKVLNNKKKQYKSFHETNRIESQTGNADDYDDASANEAKQYAFSYSVKDQDTGDDFSHKQSHLGSATKGEYRVKLPDGRVQIVSYTADNGGYKADVRYEEDKEVADNLVHENVISTTTQRPPSPAPLAYQNLRTELGRIVVPSLEVKDYQEPEYYYYYDEEDIESTKNPNYVTNDNRELLITSKPNYYHTSTANPYPEAKYVVTPKSVPYVTTNGLDSSLGSKKYMHFYDAQSVKFVSTTPNYYRGSSTPESNYHKYLNLLSSSSTTTPSPASENPGRVGLGRYYSPVGSDTIDYRKYFTFNNK